jgi:hypothetical protein
MRSSLASTVLSVLVHTRSPHQASSLRCTRSLSSFWLWEAEEEEHVYIRALAAHMMIPELFLAAKNSSSY